MSRMMRLYYYAIAGAIGGLAAWQISNVIGLSFTSILVLNELIVGALIGICIGASIGITEGILRKDFRFLVKNTLINTGLGAAGGAIGLPIAEGLFQLTGGEASGRLAGWGIFGLLLGLAAGFMSGAQVWKGALGGILGGLLGGILLTASQQFFGISTFGKAVGLMLLGSAISLFIAMIVFMLSRAWIEVKSGKMKGLEFVLDKYLNKNSPGAFIGSDVIKADIVLTDPEVAPQHAMLKGLGSHFTIKDMSMNGTYVNNKKVELVRLANHQTIRMGNTELVYYEKR